MVAIELGPETERLLADVVRAGDFADTREAVHALASEYLAPATTDADPFDDHLLDLLDEAEEDVAAGRVHRWEDVRRQVRDAPTKQ